MKNSWHSLGGEEEKEEKEKKEKKEEKEKEEKEMQTSSSAWSFLPVATLSLSWSATHSTLVASMLYNIQTQGFMEKNHKFLYILKNLWNAIFWIP